MVMFYESRCSTGASLHISAERRDLFTANPVKHRVGQSARYKHVWRANPNRKCFSCLGSGKFRCTVTILQDVSITMST